MARKGQFKKGGGRVGGGGGSRKRKASTALVVVQKRRPAKRRASVAPRRASRRRSASGAGDSGFIKAAVTGLALGSACETNNGPLGPTIYNIVQKIPGAKTFGGAATAGMAMGAVYEFTSLGGAKIRPWLKIAGLLGVGLAAIKVGITGQAFKWVGDAGDDQIMSVE